MDAFNFIFNTKNPDTIKYILEKCYSRYETDSMVYLIKNRFNAFNRLKKYPRVIVIEMISGNWRMIQGE